MGGVRIISENHIHSLRSPLWTSLTPPLKTPAFAKNGKFEHRQNLIWPNANATVEARLDHRTSCLSHFSNKPPRHDRFTSILRHVLCCCMLHNIHYSRCRSSPKLTGTWLWRSLLFRGFLFFVNFQVFIVNVALPTQAVKLHFHQVRSAWLSKSVPQSKRRGSVLAESRRKTAKKRIAFPIFDVLSLLYRIS